MPLSDMNTDVYDLKPTRRLNAREKSIFEAVSSSFVHLTAADSELLTQYAEANFRYQEAAKEAKRNPTLTVPTFNKATGNQVGSRLVRNPALTTAKEALAQSASLARRLMIDPASAEKRQRLLTRKARALQALEAEQAAITAQTFTEEEIEAEMNDLIRRGYTPRGEALRNAALDYLRIKREIAGIEDDPDCDVLFASPRRSV